MVSLFINDIIKHCTFNQADFNATLYTHRIWFCQMVSFIKCLR